MGLLWQTGEHSGAGLASTFHRMGLYCLYTVPAFITNFTRRMDPIS